MRLQHLHDDVRTHANTLLRATFDVQAFYPRKSLRVPFLSLCVLWGSFDSFLYALEKPLIIDD